MRKGFLRLTIALAAVTVGVTGLAAVGAGQASGSDAATASRFVLVVDGFDKPVTFTELDGITIAVEPSDYFESGTGSTMVRKRPGAIKPSTISLRRDQNGSLDLWEWHWATRNGTPGSGRRNGSLTIDRADGTVIGKYELINAWPSKIEIGSLKAGSTRSPLETVTLTAEAIRRVAT